MIVLYKNRFNGEIIVCEEENEKQILNNYFGKEANRKLKDYERRISVSNVFIILSNTTVYG